MNRSFTDLVQAILSQPAAPFREHHVRAEIERQLSGLPGISLDRDQWGNLRAIYKADDSPAARWLFAAHMDHPGYVQGNFLGGVPPAYLAKNAPTRAFEDFAMWDLPAYELRDGLIHSRACDDLIGCAAIVQMLRELSTGGVRAHCAGIFTRAEEVGFCGAMKAAESGWIPPGSWVISLETSSVKGGPVQMGGGVIVRVGDRSAIFDPELTATLLGCARRGEIPHQRALMSGGTCEATAYAMFGHRTAGVCVALGNYHNCGPEEQIAAEYVSLADAQAMAQLCFTVAQCPSLDDPFAAIRDRCRAELAKYDSLWLEPS